MKASVVLDSLNTNNDRLITVEYTAHRYILAEINTHRVFSRNARSSRAVPTMKLIEELRESPALPLDLAANKKGMQAGDPLEEEALTKALHAWNGAARDACYRAQQLLELGVHKQWANRVLEPFLWTHGVISSTHWDNFFKLRLSPEAQPEFRRLAELIREAIDNSKPQVLAPGEWHLPYITGEESYGIEVAREVSAARLARVSIAPFDGRNDYIAEIARADVLKKNGHWSPLEHVAVADPLGQSRLEPRNFTGFGQYRSAFDGGQK